MSAVQTQYSIIGDLTNQAFKSRTDFTSPAQRLIGKDNLQAQNSCSVNNSQTEEGLREPKNILQFRLPENIRTTLLEYISNIEAKDANKWPIVWNQALQFYDFVAESLTHRYQLNVVKGEESIGWLAPLRCEMPPRFQERTPHGKNEPNAIQCGLWNSELEVKFQNIIEKLASFRSDCALERENLSTFQKTALVLFHQYLDFVKHGYTVSNGEKTFELKIDK